MKTLENRLDCLSNTIGILAEQSARQRKINDHKREVAKELIGMSYYFNDWAGSIEECSNPLMVTAKVINQKTGQICHWMFDSFYAAEHIQSHSMFSSWEEYSNHRELEVRKEIENMLAGFGYSNERISFELQRIFNY